MLRIVEYKKALTAGALGAIAWEVIARASIMSGLPVFDIVHLLGTMVAGEGSVWKWWPLGMAMHVSVGCVWASFYAYFFWSFLDFRPTVQGAVFSLLPATLAGLVMIPQLGWMHPLVLARAMAQPRIFAMESGWLGPLAVFAGHIAFGVTLGALYTRPVGYSTTGRHVIRSARRTAHVSAPVVPIEHPQSNFMFATGIECSYPTIDGGRWRIDELEAAGHYRYWRRDLELVRELGLTHLRYGPPMHLMWLGPGKYDWSFMDDVMTGMRDLHITPILDLCHFGVPRWIGDFQNADFPYLFAEYARACAERYDDITLFTPVNEMYVTARMSALDGLWNEQLRSERAFTRAVTNVAKASALACHSILDVRRDAMFVNSESNEFFQACCPDPDIVRTADFENERRFIALDLLYGVPVSEPMRDHLLAHGMDREEYAWFMERGADIACRSIVGLDYYEWNEKLIDSDRRPRALGELFGWYVIAKQYYDRYKRPMMHTETNCQDAKVAPDWLWRQWHNVQLMRRHGVPVVGFTWYSLIDQVDWNIGLQRALGNVNPVGLYDLNRDPRPVAESYRQLVRMFAGESLLPGRRDDLPAIVARGVQPADTDVSATTA